MKSLLTNRLIEKALKNGPVPLETGYRTFRFPMDYRFIRRICATRIVFLILKQKIDTNFVM